MKEATADVTSLFGTSRIEYRQPEPEPKPTWRQRWRSHCERLRPAPGRFAELPSTVLELAGISGVSVGLYQIAPPAGWIGTGLMLIAMGVASSPRTSEALATRSAARARARVKGEGQ